MSGPKHLQLVVPNYDQSGTNPRSPLTFFRMGASFQDDDVDPPAGHRGDELLTGFSFNDDIRTPTYPGKVYVRDDGAARTTGGVGYRQQLTDELVARGGWRDHTDGNRISTTRGDCVEVVRGNYKLVVLGRVTHHWDGGGPNPNVGRTRWESSGGHNNESTSTPGEVISITWSENEDGTWRAIEQTDRGDVQSHFYGRVEEHYFGPLIESTVGVGTADSGCYGPGPAQTAQRPDVEEDTFAQSVTATHTIDAVDETLKVTGILSDTTHIHTSKTSSETAPTHESLEALGVFRDALYATTIHKTDWFFEGTRRNLTFGAAAVGLSFVGLHVSGKNKFKLGVSLHGFTFGLEATAKLTLRTFAFTNVGIGYSNGIGLTGLKAAFTLANIKLVGYRKDQYVISQDGKATDFAWANVRQIYAALKTEN